MQWILACDNPDIRQAVCTAVSNGGTGATLQVCSCSAVADRVARIQPDLVLLAPHGPIEDHTDWMREVVEVAGCDLLLVGCAAEARTILNALDAGVSRFVDRDEIDVSLPAALQALATNPTKPPQRGRVICVAGAGSGSGASTIAANIAVALSDESQGTIAVDLRLEAGDLASLLHLKARYSIADFCNQQDRMDASMFANCLSAAHRSGVQILSAPSRLSDVAKVTPRGVRRALCMARQTAPYVIVDLGQPHRPEHAQALYLAESVVVAMCLDFAALRQTQRILEYLDDQGIDRDRIKLVFNRRGRPGELRVAEAEAALGMTAASLLPEDPRRVLAANNHGSPVVEMKPRSRISRGLFELARSMNGHVGV